MQTCMFFRLHWCCAGACSADGQLVNTEDKDCEQCKADLYLFSVVSAAEPGRCVCPEHAALLKGPLKLLYRCAMHPSLYAHHALHVQVHQCLQRHTTGAELPSLHHSFPVATAFQVQQ